MWLTLCVCITNAIALRHAARNTIYFRLAFNKPPRATHPTKWTEEKTSRKKKTKQIFCSYEWNGMELFVYSQNAATSFSNQNWWPKRGPLFTFCPSPDARDESFKKNANYACYPTTIACNPIRMNAAFAKLIRAEARRGSNARCNAICDEWKTPPRCQNFIKYKEWNQSRKGSKQMENEKKKIRRWRSA